MCKISIKKTLVKHMTQYIIVPKTKSTFKCGMQLRDWKTKEDDLHLWNNRNPY